MSPAAAPSTDAVAVTTVVEVDAGTAFEVFTAEVDVWWRREPRFRDGAMRFEPGIGGRLLEVGARGTIELARVTVWEPPRRLVLAWAGTSRGARAETEVEIRFDPERDGAATRVTVEHRGWDAIPARHPARGGLMGGAFSSLIGAWWADLATSLRSHAARRAATPR